MRDLKVFLELVRIPGVFTAHADILAGALIAGAALRHIPDVILLLIASSLFYSAGMALNDYFDRDIDRKERPARPIPSGRISQDAVLFLGVVLLVVGIVLAFLVNIVSFSIALLLTLAILSYNGGLKSVKWVGPLNMGFCRYLNLLMGISILPLTLTILWIPLLTWIYIFGITVLSSAEVEGRNARAVSICLCCIVGVTSFYWLFGEMNVFQRSSGIYACILWMSFVLVFPVRLFFRTTPGDYQKAIKWLLLSLVLLDGIIVVGVRAEIWGLLIGLLIFPGGFIAKRFYVT